MAAPRRSGNALSVRRTDEWDDVAKKKGFNLSDPATLIGFIMELLVTYVFGIFTGLIAIVVAVIVWLSKF